MTTAIGAALKSLSGRLAQQTREVSTTETSGSGRRTPYDTQWGECPKHGRYKAYWVDDGGTFHFDTCPGCRRQAEVARSLEIAIPPRFRGVTVASFECFSEPMKRAKESIVAWGREADVSIARGRSFIFTGDAGTGKTHMGAALVALALRSAYTAKMLTASELISSICQTYDKAPGSAECTASVKQAYFDLDLLVIDELGRSPVSAHGADLLFEVINRRYEQCRPTVLISNLPLVADGDGLSITSLIGDAAVSRLLDGGRVIAFDWEDYRRHEKKEAA